MKKRFFALASVVVLIIMTLMLVSCDVMHVSGRGDMVSRTFDVGGFSDVNIRGVYNVVWTESTSVSVEIVMQENLFQHTDVNVRSGTLYIESNRRFNIQSGYMPRLYISSPSLEAIVAGGGVGADGWSRVSGQSFMMDIEGGANINIELDVESLEILVQGGATINLGGYATSATVTINGGTIVDASELQTVSATVTLNGAGSIDIAVSDYLNATIDGVGNIRYIGEPEVTRRTGSDSKRNGNRFCPKKVNGNILNLNTEEIMLPT